MIGLLDKTTPIGLDVGARGVRAVQMRRSSDCWTVRHAARYDYAVDAAAESSEAAPSPGEGVRACFRTAEFAGRRVVAALDSPVAQFHALELPPGISQKGTELARAVAFEVERLSTVPPGGIEMRHWSLPEPRGVAPNAIGMAAPREAVMEAVSFCEAAGLNCLKVDAAAAALGRFGSLLERWDSEAAWGILDVGSRRARLVLCVEGVPVLIRPAGVGGAAWTKSIAESLQISLK
ncbi:MAG: pilus assembly protein PilM, partial [Planctomycetes bacterium]|nr:pilus assembly protein PilM [Planctomycetota bacterium]